jgi:N6-adenosine-specific RNA methylase IME4
MPLEEICALPVGDIAHDDCVLFLWTTAPFLEASFEVLKAWGFTYRTHAVWDKGQIGMGYYVRGQHEPLLICTRGNVPVPLPENRPPSVFYAPRTEHSAKPPIVREAIEKMYPGLRRIELFARGEIPNWATWGNQAVSS